MTIGFVHIEDGDGDGLHFGLGIAIIEGELWHIGAVFGDGDDGGTTAFQCIAGGQIIGSGKNFRLTFLGLLAGGGSNFLLGINITVADDDIHRFHRGFYIVIIEFYHIGVGTEFIHGYGNIAAAVQLIILFQVPGFGIHIMGAAFHGGFGFGSHRLIGLAIQIAHSYPGRHDHGRAGFTGQGECGNVQVEQGTGLAVRGVGHNFQGHGSSQINPCIQYNIQQGAVGHAERRIHAGCILDIEGGHVRRDPFGQLQPVAVFIACIGDGGGSHCLGLALVIRPLGKHLDGLFLSGSYGGQHHGCHQHKHQQENGFSMGTRHGQKASFMIRENSKRFVSILLHFLYNVNRFPSCFLIIYKVSFRIRQDFSFACGILHIYGCTRRRKEMYDDALREKFLSGEEKFHGAIINVEHWQVELPNGRHALVLLDMAPPILVR